MSSPRPLRFGRATPSIEASSDQVESIFFPITRGVQHAQGMDADAQPIHGMSVGCIAGTRQRFSGPSSGTKVGLERFRLLCRG